MKVVLIVGPTGIGKTKKSVQLAKQYQCPVLVLDRIQCYPELYVTSGRPELVEYAGTERIYLCQRQVIDGDLTPGLAMQYLDCILDDYRRRQIDIIIIEGGSISLLQDLFQDHDFFFDYEVSIDYMRPEDDKVDEYKDKIKARVQEMLYPSTNCGSMIEEIKLLAANNETRDFVIKLAGCDKIVQLLTGQISISAEELIEYVTDKFYNYAMQQIKFLDSILPEVRKKYNISN